MKAIWNGTTIAESTDTVLVEGNHYFPASSLNRDYVQFSNHKTSCAWKGQASYYSLLIHGELLTDAVWYYPDPKPEADMVRGRVSFGNAIKVAQSPPIFHFATISIANCARSVRASNLFLSYLPCTP